MYFYHITLYLIWKSVVNKEISVKKRIYRSNYKNLNYKEKNTNQEKISGYGAD